MIAALFLVLTAASAAGATPSAWLDAPRHQFRPPNEPNDEAGDDQCD
jgi:hypothetical protein